MPNKYEELLGEFIGSAFFIGSITGVIFGTSKWQLIGSLLGAVLTVYLLRLNARH